METYSLADLERFDNRAPARGRERRFCCVGCGDDKPRDAAHRSLAVNTATGAYICHRCGLKGKLSDFFEERPRLSPRAFQRQRLADVFGLRRRPASEPRRETTDKTDAWRAWWEAAEPIADTPGAEYLAGRAMSIEIAEAAGCRYSANWYGRPAVLFPMRDRAGELVAIEGRHTDERFPKSHSAGEKKRGAFATAGAFDAPALTVCEGPIDALALSAVGLPALALCGKVAPEWLNLACALRPVILALDADEAGDKAADEIGQAIRTRGAHTLRLRPARAKDWAELIEKGAADRLWAALVGFSVAPARSVVDELADVEPITDDDARISAARRLAKAGRLEEALFIARLIESGLEWRLAVERGLRRLALALVG
jgi:hypothetical protein